MLATLLRESHPWLRHLSENHPLLVGRKSSITALVHLVYPLADALQMGLGNPRYEALWMSSTSNLGRRT